MEEEIDKVTITLSKPIWKRLAQRKLDKDIKTFDDVIEGLLNEVEKDEPTTN